MNIFYLDTNPHIAAKYMGDKHVVKMILETAQLLSTAHHVSEIRNAFFDLVHLDDIYKPTHRNHPCAVWVRETAGNYGWAYNHFCGLLMEYTHRYEKHHASERLLMPLAHIPRSTFGPFKEPPLCMPDEYKIGNAVESYRNYYRHAKQNIHSWKNRNPPEWLMENKE